MTMTFDHADLSAYILKYHVWPPPEIFLSSDWQKRNDEELLKIYQTRDRWQKDQAFSAIFNRYRLEVNHYIRGFGLSEWECKEVFTEVWAKASVKFKTFQWQGKPLNRWLIVTAKNTQYEQNRKDEKQDKIADKVIKEEFYEVDKVIKKKVSQLDNRLNDVTIEKLLEQEADKRFKQIVKMLDNKLQRQILHLIYFNGITSNQIATMLRQKPTTIRVNHHRALKKLTKLLSETHEGVH